MSSARAASFFVLLLGALGASCASSARQGSGAAALDAYETERTLLSAGEVLAIAHDLTRADADDGRFASRKASDPRVVALAAEVVKNATARLLRQEHLMSAIGAARGSDLGERIRADEQNRMEQLTALSGPEFDRAFLDGQIDYFRLVLDTYDHLLASVKDGDIRADLAEGRALAGQYLFEVRTIRALLASE
jgi:putative membrane protein